jgi:hypothetical protein
LVLISFFSFNIVKKAIGGATAQRGLFSLPKQQTPILTFALFERRHSGSFFSHGENRAISCATKTPNCHTNHHKRTKKEATG